MPVPDPERAARIDDFLGTLDRRVLLFTGSVGALALLLTLVVARNAVRPLEEHRRARQRWLPAPSINASA
jgi:hypothetical protein